MVVRPGDVGSGVKEWQETLVRRKMWETLGSIWKKKRSQKRNDKLSWMKEIRILLNKGILTSEWLKWKGTSPFFCRMVGASSPAVPINQTSLLGLPGFSLNPPQSLTRASEMMQRRAQFPAETMRFRGMGLVQVHKATQAEVTRQFGIPYSVTPHGCWGLAGSQRVDVMTRRFWKNDWARNQFLWRRKKLEGEHTEKDDVWVFKWMINFTFLHSI